MIARGILHEDIVPDNIVTAMPTLLTYLMKGGGDKYTDLAKKWTEYFILISTEDMQIRANQLV
jgi:hypothetical protein